MNGSTLHIPRRSSHLAAPTRPDSYREIHKVNTARNVDVASQKQSWTKWIAASHTYFFQWFLNIKGVGWKRNIWNRNRDLPTKKTSSTTKPFTNSSNPLIDMKPPVENLCFFTDMTSKSPVLSQLACTTSHGKREAPLGWLATLALLGIGEILLEDGSKSCTLNWWLKQCK